ncbi:MAG: hypothetical protein KAH23_10080, partial [Kiritimatiellae bacterium]|nr:hypothetical protein [Kiritimatiellia bacterium]
GLLHPGVSIINAYPADSCGNYVGADIMERLLFKQYNFGIVPEKFILNGRDSLENYEVMILPYVQYFDDGWGGELLSWVKRGGTLISLAPFGLFDKYGFAIEDGSKKVFPQTKFAIETPEKNTLSWQWHMTRDGKVVDKEYILKDYGKGIVLTILNGRALMRTEDEVAQGHESAEWGLAEKNVAAGHNSKEWGLEANDAKANKDKKAPPTWRTVRPRGSNVDVSLTAAQKVFYDVLAKSTKRKAYTKSGNIEMIVYQKEPDEPLYLSLLNWDSYHSHEPRMVVRGQYNNITDLSVADGFPIPAEIKDGVTTFPIILGPGEGLLLKLEHSNENNLN